MSQMIVANRLTDGIVVFFTADETWSHAIDDGLIIDAETDQQRHLATAKGHETRCQVVDPYLIEVEVDSGRPRPTSIREAIRAFGPTA
jgi:sulfite reductase (NADPH) hemoprotein beta-component